MNVVGRQKVLLSYARADGREAAARLRQTLPDSDFDLWQDVYSMEGGAEWWPQIERAIRSVDAVVVLITPRSFTSEVLRREWVQARRSGTPIFPVTYEADVFRAAPSWMGRYDIYILADSNPDREVIRERLIGQLKSPPPRRPVPFTVLPVPQQYAPRPQHFDALLDKVLDEGRTSRRPGIVAIQGGPGFGKTTLARALCHAPEVIEGFTDGILWATIGERGQNLAAQLNEMVGALTGSATRFDTQEEAAARLHTLTANHDCLVVLDDVWQASHIELFLGNPELTVLITTRQPEVINVTRAEPLFIEAMSSDEALQVLVNWLTEKHQPQALEPGLRGGLVGLAARLGEWPLLLNIFGSTLYGEIRRGKTVAQALGWVSQGLDAEGLAAFQPKDSDDRNRALDASMRASLRAFDETEARRLQELSIFREDDAVPEGVAVRLWEATAGVSPFAAGTLLREMEGQFFQMRVEREGGPEVIRFHDALREYLAGRLGRESARAAHEALLDSYNPSARPWHEVEDDGYLYDHLVYHLDGAGRGGEVARLFADDKWMRARFAADGYSYTGFVEDLTNTAPPPAGEFATTVAALVHAALLRTTVNSISANYVPALVGRALGLGMWTPERALSVAERNPDPASKALTYGAVWSALAPDDERRETLREFCRAAVASIGAEPTVRVLSALPAELREGWPEAFLRESIARPGGPRFFDFGGGDFFAEAAPLFSEQLLKDFLAGVAHDDAAREAHRNLLSVAGSEARRNLLSVVGRLPAGLAWLAFDFARRNLEPGDDRTKVLSALLPRLEGEARAAALSEVLDSLSRVEVKKEKVPVSMLSEILRRTGAEPEVLDLLDRHLASADARDAEGGGQPGSRRLQAYLDGSDRDRYLGGLAAALSNVADGELKAKAARALERALPHALEQLRAGRRADALSEVAAYLPDELLRECLRDALTMREEVEIGEPTRGGVLVKLAPHLRDEESRRRCLEAALAGGRHEALAGVVVALAPHLDEATLLRGGRAALKVRDPERRATLLLRLSGHLPPERRETALRLSLRAARKITHWADFARMVRDIGEQAEEPLRQGCMEELLFLENDKGRREGLRALAPRLSREQVQQCFKHSLTVGDFAERAAALFNLTEGTPDAEKEVLLRLALQSLGESGEAVMTYLRRLAPQLKGALAEEALNLALITGARPRRWAGQEGASVGALEKIIPSVGVERLRYALGAIDTAYKDKSDRAWGLVTLRAELLRRGAAPGAEAEELLGAALEIEDARDKRSALWALLPVLDGAQRLRAIEALPSVRQGLWDIGLREALPSLDAESARALLGHVKGSVLGESVTYARALLATRLDEPERTRILLDVSAQLQRIIKWIALFKAPETAEIYVTLLRHLKGADHERVFEAALAEPNEEIRALVLAELAPELEGADFGRALDAALAITAPLPRARALPAFLPRAPDGEKLKALILEALRGHLSAVQHEPRSEVLKLCADGLLFGAPAFTPDTLKAFAEDVVEVCWRWRWQ